MTNNKFTLDEMKDKITIKQYQGLQAAFDYFNDTLFKSSLPDCVLTLNRSRHSYGYFVTKENWQDSKGEKYNEIALNPDEMILGDEHRTDKDIMSTLVHEMCHLWQHYDGSEPRRGYHNKDFAEKMERVGLFTTADYTWEGKRTGQNMGHLIIEGGAFDKAYENMPSEIKIECHTLFKVDAKKKRANKAKKRVFVYTCPKCGATIKGRPGMNLICGDCKVAFEMEKPEDENN